MTAHTTKDDKLQQYNTLPFGSDELKIHETLIENKTRGSQEPVIAHLVFNLTFKVNRKWGCYT